MFLARVAALLFWHLTELDELLDICLSLEALESLHLCLVRRKNALCIADAAYSWENSRTLNALCKAAEDAEVIFVCVS